MRKAILESVEESIQVIKELRSREALDFMEAVSSAILNTYHNEGKILIAGNGGSLCDAIHFAEELTGFFREDRQAISALALADPGHLTCVGNDKGFAFVFSRGVEAHGKKRDILMLLSTSGLSENLIHAAQAARQRQMKTIAFLGKTGGQLKGLCDLEWIVSNQRHSDRIQEAHMAAMHIIIEMVEKSLIAQLKQETTASIGL